MQEVEQCVSLWMICSATRLLNIDNTIRGHLSENELRRAGASNDPIHEELSKEVEASSE